MKLGYTIIYVHDVPKTVKFYEKAFGLQLRFLHESNGYAEMETGETTLAFASEELAESHGFGFRTNKASDKSAGFEIAFVTTDVNATFRGALEAGAEKLSVPSIKPWGQTVSYVRDLNGIIVEICSPVG